MLKNNKDYSLLVMILVCAIAISLFFHVFFRQETNQPLTELYFPYIDMLPDKVSAGEDYDFSFIIKNHPIYNSF